jgi:hypothetical protein
MILHTHFFDYIAKLLLVALAVAIFFIIRLDYWQDLLISHGGLKEAQANLILFVFICIGIVLPLIAFVYLPLLSPVAAWFYLWFSLKTPVSWPMAQKVESLFRPTLKRAHWYPMTHLKDLPVEDREPELLRFFEQASAETWESSPPSWIKFLSKKGQRLYFWLLGICAFWHLYCMFDQSGLVGIITRLLHGPDIASAFIDVLLATVVTAIPAGLIAYLYDYIAGNRAESPQSDTERGQ